jgi:hypothetical protein
MQSSVRLAAWLVAAVTASGCAQILGIDDRSVGVDGGDGHRSDTDAGGDAMHRGDARPTGDGGATGDARADRAIDVVASADHQVADAPTGPDAVAETSVPHDASTDTSAAETSAADAKHDVATTECDGGAVDLETDPDHCGTCTNACTVSGAHSQATCANGTCGTACTSGWGDCNDAGACQPVTADPQNCGACGHVCSGTNTMNSAGTCTAGACVFDCTQGTAHCTTDDSKGCLTPISDDPSNCGACGYVCGGTATCAAGICRLTTGGESIGVVSSMTSLVQDTGALYWANVTGGATTQVLRTVKKDGTGLATLGTATNGPRSPSLTVDADYIYYSPSTAPLYEELKSGVTAATLLEGTQPGPATTGGVLCDGDATHDATNVFYTLNAGAGLYRVPIAAPSTRTEVFTSSSTRGMALWGTTLYFGATATNQIEYIDTTQASPVATPLATLPSAPTALATDGVNVYAIGYSGGVYQVSIASSTMTTIATNTAGDGALTTDGINVYAAMGNNLYRIPVNGPATPVTAYEIVSPMSLPGIEGIWSAQVDATSVYFVDETDVFKMKK